MHKGFLGILAATMLAVGTVHADDLLGGKGKKGGGSSQSGGSSGGSSSGGSRGGGSSQSGGSGSSRGGGSSQSGGSGSSRGGGSSQSGGSGSSRGGGSSQSGGSSRGGSVGESRGGGALGGGSSSGGNRGGSSSGSGNQQGGGFARGGDEFLGRRSGSSRSGSVTYGNQSNNNHYGGNDGPVRIGDRPIVIGGGNVSQGVWSEDRVQRADNGNYRRGYYNYNRNWCDDYFWYPHYSFTYIPDRCVPSPFYYYSNLPAYINTVRIDWGWGSINFYETCKTNYVWIGNQNSGWGYNNGWDNGNWRSGGGWGNDRVNELDYAIEDIVDSFRYQSIRSMSYMISTRDYVNIEMSGDIRYRLRGDDFYDLMTDLVGGTYTTNYRIVNVRTGRGEALVEAEHEYRDAWNRRQVSRHIYGLREYRGRYAVEYFGVR